MARRIALRDAKAQPWRMLLVILLIGLPVFGMALAGTLQLSTSSTDAWAAERRYAGFDGVIERDVVQQVTPEDGAIPGVSPEDAAMYFPDTDGMYTDVDAWFLFASAGVADVTVDQARALWRRSEGRRTELPAGVTVHRVVESEVEVLAGDQRASGLVRVVDPDDAALFGADSRFDVRSGGLDGDGILVDRELARTVGDQGMVTVRGGALDRDTSFEVPVAGTMVDRVTDDWRWADLLPLPASDDTQGYVTATLLVSADSALGRALTEHGTAIDYLDGPVPDDYLDVLAFARAGDRAQFLPLLHQPENEGAQLIDAVFQDGGSQPLDDVLMLPLLFLGTLALVETGLLAGAAFAVGARRSRRVGALLAVVGAESGTVASMLRWQGLVCGLVGAVGGGVLGVATGLAIVLSASARGVVLPPAAVPWPLVLSAMAVGVLSALVAAWIPARAIAGQNAWAAVRTTNAATPAPSRARAVYALVLVAVAVGATVTATVWLRGLRTLPEVDAFFPVYGIVLTVSVVVLLVGALMLVPMAVHLLGRAAGRLPLSLRLAARDADRNRGRTVPVTAAMGAAAAIAVLALTMLAVAMTPFSGDRQAGLPTNVTLMPVPDPEEIKAEFERLREEDPNIDEEWLGFTGGTDQAAELVRRVAKGAGLPEVTAVEEVLSAVPDCEVAGSPDCEALGLTYPASSQCHLPVPDDPHAAERSTTLYELASEADLQQARACAWGRDPFDPSPSAGVSGLNLAQDILVVDPDRPETMPRSLVSDEGARRALAEGRVVVYDPEYVSSDGTVDLGSYTEDVAQAKGIVDRDNGQAMAWDSATGEYVDAVMHGDEAVGYGVVANAPAGAVLWEPELMIHPKAYTAPAETAAGWRAVVPQHLLPELGQRAGAWGLAVTFAEAPTVSQWEDLGLALGDEGLYTVGNEYMASGVDVDRVLWGIALVAGLALVTVSGITTGLALADSRRDGQVMDAVGAAPGTRRRQAAAQAGVAAALGAMLGLVVGALPALSTGSWLTSGFAWMPWPQLAVVLLGAPVLAAVLAWLLVPGRMPARERRS
ncbi:putative permease [Micrococcus lylae]|uniref:Putative permease n=1 Tax=Micrococcus lylae TaxID=1273 RepID=A0A1R4JCF5_9MICC|nr:FtsX-like permease family protein [Micrococcus lylae]SJN29831.1 putative permease [Micrococcus lylae]